MIWQTLVEFLCHLTFGVAASMASLPARWVTSGFFRVHLWVLMGVQTFAALALWSLSGGPSGNSVATWQISAAIVAAVVSYVGAVIWMYEASTAGKASLLIVAAAALVTCLAPAFLSNSASMSPAVRTLQVITSGAVSGLVTTAMLLGHWYLNTPTMRLDPLKRLLVLLIVAIAVRMMISGIGAVIEGNRLSATAEGIPTAWMLFVGLRWTAGLILPLVLTYLTWQTLKIPNTQSATGILYAGVILVFIGELCAQMLSVAASFPL
ncbi:hypothetical protein [Anatilimnocola floriformis]|uniref:hypothetical protein n=1 Tax=Anatilimnocola floriformis TaxID=2948575 RepID=UPI0020C4BE38|nr:hypothetical protein [Anatilimnocola floriformis]